MRLADLPLYLIVDRAIVCLNGVYVGPLWVEALVQLDSTLVITGRSAHLVNRASGSRKAWTHFIDRLLL